MLLIGAGFLTAAYYYFVTFDFNRLKSVIENKFSDATGRELKIHGNIDVVFDINPSVAFYDITISNTAWGSRPQMVAIDSLVCDLSLSSLFRRVITVTRINLAGLDILIERNDKGLCNCALFALYRMKPEKGRGRKKYLADMNDFFSVYIDEMTCADGTIQYRDTAENIDITATVDDLLCLMNEDMSEWTIRTAGRFRDDKFTLDGIVDGSAAGPDVSGPLSIEFQGTVGDTSLNVDGTIDDMRDVTGLNLTVSVWGEHIGTVATLLGMNEVGRWESFNLAATITGSLLHPAFADAVMQAKTNDGIAVKIRGDGDDIRALSGLRLDVDVQGDNFEAVNRILKTRVPYKGPFEFSGDIEIPKMGEFRCQRFDAAVDGDDFHGSGTVTLVEGKPVVRGTITSNRVDARRFFARKTEKRKSESEVTHMAGPGDIDVDVTFLADAVILDTVGVENARGHVTTDGDVLTVDELTAVVSRTKDDDSVVRRVLAGALDITPAEKGLAVAGDCVIEIPRAQNIVTNGADVTTVHFVGEIGNPRTMSGADIDIEIQGHRAVTVAEWFDLDELYDYGPFDATGTLIGNLEHPRVSDAVVRLSRGDDITVTARGDAVDIRELRDLRFTFTAHGEKIDTVKNLFHSSLPYEGPFMISGDVEIPRWNTFRFHRFAGRVANDDICGSGTLIIVDGTPVIRGSYASHSLDVRRFFRKEATEQKINGAPPAKGMDMDMDIDVMMRADKSYLPWCRLNGYNGHISLTEGTLTLSHFSATVSRTDAGSGESAGDLGGTMLFDWTGEKTMIAGRLTSDSFDMSHFIDEEDKKMDMKAEKDKKRVFSDKTMLFDGLNTRNYDVIIEVKDLKTPWAAVSDLSAGVSCIDGFLNVERLRCSVYGGELDGRLSVMPQNGDVTIRLDAAISGSDAAPVMTMMKKRELVKGRFDARADIETTGNSWASMMAHVTGKALVVMEEGRINTDYLEMVGTEIGTTLLNLINPFQKDVDHSAVNCFVSGLEMDEGAADIYALAFDTDQVSVIGRGSIDLGSEKLDISLSPSLKRGIGIDGIAKVGFSIGELSKSFKIGGTLAEPTMVLDPEGTLITIGKAVGGMLLFGPAGIAAALLSFSVGDEQPCKKIAKAAKASFDATAEKAETDVQNSVSK